MGTGDGGGGRERFAVFGHSSGTDYTEKHYSTFTSTSTHTDTHAFAQANESFLDLSDQDCALCFLSFILIYTVELVHRLSGNQLCLSSAILSLQSIAIRHLESCV